MLPCTDAMVKDPFFFDECGVRYRVLNPLGNSSEFGETTECVAVAHAEVGQYKYEGFEIVHIRCWDQQRVVGSDGAGVSLRAHDGVAYGFGVLDTQIQRFEAVFVICEVVDAFDIECMLEPCGRLEGYIEWPRSGVGAIRRLARGRSTLPNHGQVGRSNYLWADIPVGLSGSQEFRS